MGRTIRDGARVIACASKLAALGCVIFSYMALSRPALADTAPACNADDPNQVRLVVSVSGMRSAKGNVQITIYPDEPSHFLDGAYKLSRQELPVTLPVTRACFVVAAPGAYAVALFQDENNTHHLDRTPLGIPAEGFGFSNNPKLYFGPPALSRVLVTARHGENPISVRMQYY